MDNKQASVRLEHVTKRFKNVNGRDDVYAVKDSNLEIKSGELVTLLGPSGCGKTTTLRMIAGFELPSEGKVFIGENDVTMLPPNKRDTATVFQSYGLFPHMNVFENVAYGLKLRKVDADQIKSRVNEALSLVGLEDLADRSSGALSGGQQQRVALARSLIVNPAVLLLDEPLSNLDALLREQMRVEIRRIQQAGKITAVYVTHDRVEAMSLSDRVVVMKDGIIQQIGTPSDTYENPQSKFVAGFVGKVAFFPAEFLEYTDEVSVTPGGTSLVKCKINFAGKTISDISVPYTNERPDFSDKKCLIMARPESLVIEEAGVGMIPGTVKTNIYLGSSIESFVETQYGEILVQIDAPAGKKIFAENTAVSVSFSSKTARVLPDHD